MKKFRTYQPDQLMLLPPNLQDWLPAQHLARYISDVVDHVLDLTEILQAYDELKGGQPPYHPAMMVKLILFGYCVGVKSSREIEKATWESIPFRVLAANQHPDHSAISMFRKRHLNALGKLFHQSLYFAVKEGMVSLEVVAVDGTKIEANAARGKTLTIDGVADREKKLQQVVDEILAEAEEIDAEEDRKYGSKSLLDVVKYQGNIERLKELKKQMEEEQAEAEREKESRKKKPTAASKAKQKKREERERKEGGATKASKAKKPNELRRNVTDYDSRLMRTTGGNWGQTYNAQAVVDAKAQVVVACTVTNDVNDGRQLAPMFRQTIANTGRKPDVGLGDKGYFSGAALQDPELRGIKLLVPPPIEKELKIRHGRRAFLPSDEMKTLLAEPENKRLYGLRQITVEPVFGQIKAAMKFRKFSVRGLGAVSNEWSLVCAAHNLLKVFRSGWCLS